MVNQTKFFFPESEWDHDRVNVLNFRSPTTVRKKRSPLNTALLYLFSSSANGRPKTVHTLYSISLFPKTLQRKSCRKRHSNWEDNVSDYCLFFESTSPKFQRTSVCVGVCRIPVGVRIRRMLAQLLKIFNLLPC